MEPTTLIPSHLTFIGGGHLAQALISGIYSTSAWKDRCSISITARRSAHANALKEQYPSAFVTTDNLDPAIWSRENTQHLGPHILFICTRPADVPDVALQLAPVIKTLDADARPTVVTMCPGISVKQLQSWLPKDTPIVRSMPNTPVACCQGATGLFPSSDAHKRVESVAFVLRDVSPAVCILSEESQLDVVAAISGSAPAHFYYLIESIISAAASHNLSPEIAQSLVVQSCIGAGFLARDAGKPIHRLREEVCVPGGSTEKAISHMARHQFPDTVATAIEKSLQANREMQNVSRRDD